MLFSMTDKHVSLKIFSIAYSKLYAIIFQNAHLFSVCSNRRIMSANCTYVYNALLTLIIGKLNKYHPGGSYSFVFLCLLEETIGDYYRIHTLSLFES